MENCACIPTTPDGSVLRKCTEIINPQALFSRLFDETDCRFPVKRLTDDLALTALKSAGMIDSSLPWELIIDRAQSIEAVMEMDPLRALNRVSLILSTISTSKPPSSGLTIDSIPFLPVMKKPKDYPLKWYGDKYQLLPGSQLVLLGSSNRNMKIAGSQVAFVCEDSPEDGGCGNIHSSTTRKLLKLRPHPTLVEVTSHLKSSVDWFQSSSSPSCDWTGRACSTIYDFVDKLCQKEKKLNLAQLKAFPCIWNGSTFLEVDSIATNWKMKDGPYLFATPPNVASKEAFTAALGIKDTFQFHDAILALQLMMFDFGASSISKTCMELITEMTLIFQKASPAEFKNLSEVLYLPDNQKMLRPSTELVYNDVSWVPLDNKCKVVNSVFSRKLAISLGVRLETSKLLEQYVSKKEQHFHGVPFGQHEELTGRIQNIIRDYPFDVTILKELLQNADDAKAKKMYIILDRRTHGKESVISKEWQELQGPALLIWNDSTFSEDDLKGIQELGLGSKRSDAETIGQFGIGFNVVYHLTDCPSFVTGGDTLCVLDPHCRYVPEANVSLPGGRYDNLSRGFWKEFKDMGSAYLQTGMDNLPEDFRDGSLFRFPIRHSNKMMQSSEIVYKANETRKKDLHNANALQPLTAESLSKLMDEWMPHMKQAMFFLNHITEIKYFEIDNVKKTLLTKSHYKTTIALSPEDTKMLRTRVANFTEPTGCKPYVIFYPMVLTDVDCTGKKQDKKEKWLIQQGIGDSNDENQYWRYVKTVKPKHAIAASLDTSKFEPNHSGQLFCFLPLPTRSGVPVHVNGSFVLNSTRRGLWVSTDPKVTDDKSLWNNRLFKAISSSYARFLVHARHHYFKRSYNNWTEALDALHNYYKLFPTFMVTDVSKKWESLSCNVYKSLIQSNAEVLCILVSDDRKGLITVEWHKLISENPVHQVHCWSGTKNRKVIHPILQSMGLKITSAPSKIIDCLNTVFSHQAKLERDKQPKMYEQFESNATSGEPSIDHQKKIPLISPLSVFEYYTQHSQLSSSCDAVQFPISDTIFKETDTFLIFVKYLVGMDLESSKSKPEEPAPRPSTGGSGVVASKLYTYGVQLFSSKSGTISPPLSPSSTATPVLGTALGQKVLF